MNKILPLLLILLLIIIRLLTSAQEFDPADVAVLKTIRDQAPADSPLKTEWANEDSVAVWVGITWDTSLPKRVSQLSVLRKNLTSLDVTGLKKLYLLDCRYNQITQLKVTGLSVLYYLYCFTNNITQLDLTGLMNLSYLSVSTNQLSSLDVSGLSRLLLLDCSNNLLTSLNVNGLTNLQSLSFRNNKIPFSQMPFRPPSSTSYTFSPQNKIFEEINIPIGTEIDFSSEAVIDGASTVFTWYKNNEMISGTGQTGKYTPAEEGWYYCTMTNEKFTGLTLTTNAVKAGDPSLCYSGDMAVLKAIRDNAPSFSPLKTEWADEDSVATWPGVTWNTSVPKRVVQLKIISKNLTSLNVTGLTKLQQLECSMNMISNLVVTGLSDLYLLYCYQNKLSDIDLTGLLKLGQFNCANNLLTSLDVNGLPSLMYLFCHSNQLTSLHLTGLPKLYRLICSNNRLTSLNVTELSGLNILEISYNKFTSIDVTGLTKLTELQCYNNQLSELIVTGLSSLKRLYCSSNLLTLLNLSGLTNLNVLACNYNSISTLDLSGMNSLQTLSCSFNQISSLDVSTLKNLVNFGCGNNKLTLLDVSGLTNLKSFNCIGSRLTSLKMDTLVNYFNVQIYNNNLSFSQLPLEIKVRDIYKYAPQGKIFEERSIDPGQEIDYSGEALIGGVATEYTWYRNFALIPDAGQTGKYTPAEEGWYYCTMTNPKFPGLILTTHFIRVGEVDPLPGSSCMAAIDYGSVNGPARKGILGAGEHAWFKLVVNDTLHDIGFITEKSVINTKIAVYSACPDSFTGSPVNPDGCFAYNDNYLTNDAVIYIPKLGPGTYYAVVYGADEWLTGEYTFSIIQTAPPDSGDVAVLIAIRDNAPWLSPLKNEWSSVGDVFYWPGVYWNQKGRVCSLDVHNVFLSCLEITALSQLQQLNCYSNEIDTLDLSGLTNLEYVNCNANDLHSLNLNGLINLEYLSCSMNKLNYLDLKTLYNIEELQCNNNQLIDLDITGSDSLTYLRAYDNSLKTIDLNVNSLLTVVYLYNNNLPFSQLPLPGPSFSTYTYSPQKKIFEEKNLSTGTLIDFSSEALINGVATEFNWYREDVLIPGTDQSGTFTPFETGVYYCKMSNNTFTGLILQTCDITVIDPVCREISLTNGWNLFSTDLFPVRPDMKSLFQPLIDEGKLIKVQDESGHSLEDFGLLGGWINNIGNIFTTEGYKVRVSGNSQLRITGAPVKLPLEIHLNMGWNIISFPFQYEVNAMTFIQQLVDRKTLFKVQDEKGNSVEDYSIFGGWINNIGSLKPGEGYKVKVTTNEVLTIPESFLKSGLLYLPELKPTVHFHPQTEGNGVDHMNINLVDIRQASLQSGDEIAVFDGDQCVGALKLLPVHINSNCLSIPVSADGGTGTGGFTEGNPITLKVWKSQTGLEFVIKPEVEGSQSLYLRHESIFITLSNQEFIRTDDDFSIENQWIKCYPNPFGNQVIIEAGTVLHDKTVFEIFDNTGRLIREILPSTQQDHAQYRIKWDGKDENGHKVAPGIYHLRLLSGNTELHCKLVCLE